MTDCRSDTGAIANRSITHQRRHAMTLDQRGAVRRGADDELGPHGLRRQRRPHRRPLADPLAAGSGDTAIFSNTRWLFAEGSQGYFDTFILPANDGAAEATATVTFLIKAGSPVRLPIVVLAPRAEQSTRAMRRGWFLAEGATGPGAN
jgi:hypothetical protein